MPVPGGGTGVPGLRRAVSIGSQGEIPIGECHCDFILDFEFGTFVIFVFV